MILVSVFAAAALPGLEAAAGTVYGKPQILGKGSAQFYATLDAKGAPQAIGVTFEEGMLEELPAAPNTYSRCFDKNGDGTIGPRGECNGDYELTFHLADQVADPSQMPFKWVSVNWNPEGHPPPAPPPWAVPHFDFHFYIQDRESVRAIRPGRCSELIDCDDFKRAQNPVPAKYVHADHIDVGAAVPDMGNHLIDSKSPELAENGPPFTHTFIFGAYDGHVTFYEPMITRAFLESRPDTCAAIKLPQAWELKGYYPTQYCMRYHNSEGRYTVSLEGFKFRETD